MLMFIVADEFLSSSLTAVEAVKKRKKQIKKGKKACISTGMKKQTEDHNGIFLNIKRSILILPTLGT